MTRSLGKRTVLAVAGAALLLTTLPSHSAWANGTTYGPSCSYAATAGHSEATTVYTQSYGGCFVRVRKKIGSTWDSWAYGSSFIQRNDIGNITGGGHGAHDETTSTYSNWNS